MDLYQNAAEGHIPNHRLVHFCKWFCFVNNILEPTHVISNTKSLNDVALSSHHDYYATSGTLHLGVSDHDLIFVVRKNKIWHPRLHFVRYCSLKNFNLAAFLSDLNDVP